METPKPPNNLSPLVFLVYDASDDPDTCILTTPEEQGKLRQTKGLFQKWNIANAWHDLCCGKFTIYGHFWYYARQRNWGMESRICRCDPGDKK